MLNLILNMNKLQIRILMFNSTKFFPNKKRPSVWKLDLFMSVENIIKIYSDSIKIKYE